MSPVVDKDPMEKDTGILFGDGAGAVLVRPDEGRARVVDALLASDGNFANELKLDAQGLYMNGRAVILQASRKIPRVILDLLARNQVPPGAIDAFVMHQANQNLIDKVAQTVGVPSARFFSNIARYGNTSSASMLIAAAEWDGFRPGAKVVFAGFGAGFHWGAVLAEGC
jgi:3-oxoacyl-[acyl-carrier-protein] synthase-3